MDSVPDPAARMDRRGFLKGAAATAGLVAASSVLPTGSRRLPFPAEEWWLGPDLWANRLQDWCLRAHHLRGAGRPAAGPYRGPAHQEAERWSRTLVVQTGTNTTGTGFSGFLVGTGEPGRTTGGPPWS